jgi:glycosyltransferase involved in cell wall biosynthesis
MGFTGLHTPRPLFLYRKRNQVGRDYSSHGHEARLRATVNSYHPDLYTPKLSVVIPTYRHTHLLAETLNSIRQQTYHDYEVIVVDDGNEDSEGVVAVVQKFHEDFPIRVVRHERNQGLAASRNTGVRVARGSYILTLDSDDLIKPTFMERTIDLLDARPDIAIVYTDVETFSPVGNQILEMPDYDFDLLLQKNLMACASPYRKEVWEKVGGYKIDMVYGWEDYLFWIEAGRKGMCGLHIPEPLFMYRQTGGSMIREAQKHVGDMRRQLREHVPDVFRGEKPTMCCGRTRMSQGVGMSQKRGFVAPSPSVGEYALIHLHYKGDRELRLRTAVTNTFWSLRSGQNLYVDPRDVPQLLSRGDFEYALDEELEEALT